MNMFKKATKEQSKLRLAIFGPAGSGKTFTALRIAKGLGENIAVVDTERGSASKYSDRFSFDVAELRPPTIDNYIKFIEYASEYDVLIIDSLSHGWQELLDEIDKLAKAKYKGNTWSAWSEGTPKQRKLVDAILNYDGHVIATMRSKTEWTTEASSNGKSRPIRVGLAPEQGKGIEYEFDMLLEMSTDHIGNVIKDRTGKFQDKLIEFPDEKFGSEIKAWLSEGVKPDTPKKALAEAKERVSHEAENKGEDEAQVNVTDLGNMSTGNGEHDKITRDQKTQLFAIAKKHLSGNDQFISILDEHGYSDASDIYQPDLDAIVKTIKNYEGAD